MLRPLQILAGNGIGQVVALGAIPVITRLYDVAAIGTFGLFSATATSVATVAALCLDQAIVASRDDTDLRGLQWGGLGVAVCFALAACMALAAIGPSMLDRLAPIGCLAWLMPAAVLLTVLLQILVQTATLKRRLGQVAHSLALRTGGTAAGQIALAGIMPSALGMIIGQMIALAAASGLLARPNITAIPTVTTIRQSFQDHADCPRYLAPRLALSTLADLAVYVLIGAVFDTRQVGFFWMAQRLLQVPSGFIDVPTRQIFLSLALDRRDQGRPITPVLLAVLGGLVATGALVTVAIFAFGSVLIPAVLGPAWAPTIPFAMTIACGWTFELGSIPFSGAVVLLGQQRSFLAYEVISRSLRLAAIVAGCWTGDLMAGLAGMAGASMLAVGGYTMVLISQSEPRQTLEESVLEGET